MSLSFKHRLLGFRVVDRGEDYSVLRAPRWIPERKIEAAAINSAAQMPELCISREGRDIRIAVRPAMRVADIRNALAPYSRTAPVRDGANPDNETRETVESFMDSLSQMDDEDLVMKQTGDGTLPVWDPERRVVIW